MGNLLFSPNGSIGSSEMIKGGIILIILGLLLGLGPLLGLPLGMTKILNLLAFLLIVPWVFLWIKRYRDGGKSGVMCLLPIIVYIVLILVGAMVFVGGSVFGAAMEASQSGASQAETTAVIEAAMGNPKTIAIKTTIMSIVVSLLVLFGFNAMIKSAN